MDEKQKKEYQTIILAALLHDIGKFLHRGDGKYKGSHEEASKGFIDNFYEKLCNNEFYDLDLIRLLVQHHHALKRDTFKNPYFNDLSKTEKNRIWKLLTIVKRADSYSCAERDIKEPGKKDVGSKRAPLDSIFSNINLDIGHINEEDNYRYHVKKIDR